MDWHDRLRSSGHRLTPQRQLVLEAVVGLGHATPDEILIEVQRTAQAVNASTVYRTLDLLEELGLVTHAHLGHGAPTFHPVTDDPHIHLVCSRCHGIEEVETTMLATLADELTRSRGFSVDVGHVALTGLCSTCQPAAMGEQQGTVQSGTGSSSR